MSDNNTFTFIRTFDQLIDYVKNNRFSDIQNGIRDANNDKGIWIKKTKDGFESVIMSNMEMEKEG